MTDREALAAAFARAGGSCECIGGGCASLSHRPGVNRCATALDNISTTSFVAVSRFADRTHPENVIALCTACGEVPRRQGLRLPPPRDLS